MATTDDFVDACAAAGDALSELGYTSAALSTVATNDQDANVAALAHKFATVTGPKSLQRAMDKGDAQELVMLQRGLKGVSQDVDEELVGDAITRFLLFPISPLLALAPHEVLDKAKNALADLHTPPAPQDLPLPMFLGVGAVAGAALALVNTGSPKGALVGAAGGAVLGWLVKLGLERIGNAFTFGGASS